MRLRLQNGLALLLFPLLFTLLLLLVFPPLFTKRRVVGDISADAQLILDDGKMPCTLARGVAKVGRRLLTMFAAEEGER